LTAAYLVCVAALVIIPSLAFLPPLMFFGSMLNLGLILAISVVTLSGFVFPKRYPDLFEKASMPFSARSLRIICGTILLLNTLIFGFFAVAIGKASLVFLGIVLACCIYARSQKRRLTEIRESLSPAEPGSPTRLFWMEEEERYEG
jgi:protein-S-isoprenylcysteine O-methyltransferase Ste14